MRAPKLAVGSVGTIRAAGLCGLVAFVTFNVGWIAGDIAQPRAFSPANDDISYLGALTASKPWLYNQLAANVSGILVIALGIGLWHALDSSRLGRIGAAAWVATGLGTFLDGLFRLDCQPIDAGCSNDSWHSHAHKIESGFTAAATFLALVLVALGFRRTHTGATRGCRRSPPCPRSSSPTSPSRPSAAARRRAPAPSSSSWRSPSSGSGCSGSRAPLRRRFR